MAAEGWYGYVSRTFVTQLRMKVGAVTYRRHL